MLTNSLLKYFPSVSLSDLHFISRTVKHIDKNMYGRYCGSFEDKLVQGLSYLEISRKFKHFSATHLEIGVLFGGSCILKGLILQNEKLEKKQDIIAIDPLSGYYGQTNDPNSGMPINKESFLINIRNFKLNPKNTHIIESTSQNLSKTLPLLSKHRLISLMIDGDHSYQGIKNDFSVYGPLIEKGGCLIIDDFGDISWPEVTQYTKDHILTLTTWTPLVHYDTTLVLIKN